MIELRPYQIDLIKRIRDEMRCHRSVLVVSPTGSGKTALAAFMISRAAEKGRRVWMIVHRDFLITQTSRALDDAGVSHGFIAAGREYNPYQKVHIVAINTVGRRLHKLTPPDFIIIDEAHHTPAASWRGVQSWAGNVCRFVGLTASPARTNGEGLGRYYSALVNGPSVGWLIARNYLSAYRAFAPSTPDLSGIRARAGDYASDQLAGVMDTGQIAGNIVGTYKRLANGKRAIYYAVSVDHSQHLVHGFQAAGVAAIHLDAQSTTGERAGACRSFSDGDISVIVNVDLFGEGFDLSASAGRDVSVEAVGLCRPTQSLTLHLQQCGRALRPKEQPAIILDHAGNLMRHGLPDDEREWTLAGVRKTAKDRDIGAPVRMCEACYAVFGAATRVCPYCGAQAALSPREVEEIQADLVAADRELLQAAKHRELQRAKTLEELIAIGVQRGYNKPHGWARHIMEARGKKWQKSSSPTVRNALLTSLTSP